MNDEEIIKVLECCRDTACYYCPNLKLGKCIFGCKEKAVRDALDLIRKQQAEIEQLKSLCASKDATIKAQEAAIERLNGNLFTISNACMQRRNEAIKEFAERLKMKAYLDNGLNGFLRSTVIDVNDIDNLVKEVVGGENA